MTAFLPAFLIGAALGGANAAASYLLVRRAQGRDQSAFVRLVFGGLAVRLFVMALVVLGVLGLTVLDAWGFIAGLLVTFVMGTLLEGALLLKIPPVPADAPARPGS